MVSKQTLSTVAHSQNINLQSGVYYKNKTHAIYNLNVLIEIMSLYLHFIDFCRKKIGLYPFFKEKKHFVLFPKLIRKIPLF